jgi:lipoprotein-releasing system ATP-binding protein
MNNSSFLLSCQHVGKTFQEGKNKTEIFSGINLDVTQGEQIAIVGASGAGKSTLLHILGGLDIPSTGDVIIEGQRIHHLSEYARSRLRNHVLGFVYQFHHLLPEFSVIENVAMPLLIRGLTMAEAQVHALEVLEGVGLAHRLQHLLGELSGGERQRTAIARALVTKPKCILADEPTGNLDFRTAEKVYQHFLELNQQLNTSLIIVTHDRQLAARMNRILELRNGTLECIR